MSDEFEKKSGKKVGKKFGVIAIILLFVIAAGVGGWFYLKSVNKPEKIFTKAIDDAFGMNEKNVGNAAKVELGITAELGNTRDAQLKLVNSMLKDVKLNLMAELDTKKSIFNGNLVATYAGDEIANTSVILQDDTMYFYLKDLYSKYIEIDSKYFEEEGIELASLFESTDFPIEELTKDIKDILVESLNNKEFEQEKAELNGKKVKKTTVKYSLEEMAEIVLKIMKKMNKYEPNDELEDLIDELEEDIDYIEDEEIFLEVSLYSTGAKNEIVKMEAVLYEEDYMALVLEEDKKSDKETVITFSVNEDDSDKDDAEQVAKVTINEKDSNSGTATLDMEVEGVEVKINIDYAIDYNAKVSKKDVSNSILADDMTEEDFKEIRKNIEKNPLLYEILKDSLDDITPVTTTPVYEIDYYNE